MQLNFNNDERKFLIKVLKDYEGNPREIDKLVKRIEKSMRPIKVRSAKGKGRSLQVWVCEKIASMFQVKYEQSDDNCLVHSREMGQRGVDVVLRGDVYDKFKYDVECKAQETLSIPDWIEQAKSNNNLERDWLLVVKKQSVGEPFVVMSWDAFERLYEESATFQSFWKKSDTHSYNKYEG